MFRVYGNSYYNSEPPAYDGGSLLGCMNLWGCAWEGITSTSILVHAIGAVARRIGASLVAIRIAWVSRAATAGIASLTGEATAGGVGGWIGLLRPAGIIHADTIVVVLACLARRHRGIIAGHRRAALQRVVILITIRASAGSALGGTFRPVIGIRIVVWRATALSVRLDVAFGAHIDRNTQAA